MSLVYNPMNRYPLGALDLDNNDVGVFRFVLLCCDEKYRYRKVR